MIKKLCLALICAVVLITQVLFAKEKLLVLGADEESISIIKAEFTAKYEVSWVSDAGMINISYASLLLILGEQSLSAIYRLPIHNFLKAGGNVILIGPQSLNYAPKPRNAVSVVSFNDDYTIVYPKRRHIPRSVDLPEVSLTKLEHTKAIQFATNNRGMKDVGIAISLKEKSSATRSVISFKAKGSHFMDLLALEIKDIKGNKWYSFMPIDKQWKDYAISFADFIPEGWLDASSPYPLLQPDHVDSLFIGINTLTVWKEKAMNFSLADIKVTETTSPYTPSSILATLRLPFKEIGIVSPDWIIAPFINTKAKTTPTKVKSVDAYFELPKFEKELKVRWSIPTLFYEHPGTAMGTDTDKKYDYKSDRLFRTEKILVDEKSGETLAVCINYASGSYKTGSLSLFGFNSKEVIHLKNFSKCLTAILDYTHLKPKILNVGINTTKKEQNSLITPLLKVSIFNPNKEAIEAKLAINVAGKLKSEMPVVLKPKEFKEVSLKLDSIPKDFPFVNFVWEARLITSSYTDLLKDTINLERSLQTAFKYLVNAQNFYPDGRYSNHYFGDAYGVRAMFAYLDYSKNRQNYLDDVDKVAIKNSATFFYDMLVKRQRTNGAYPMGYSEHTGGYNIADGGQIALSLGQSLQYVTDSVKSKAYLNSILKFANWAESYYIDTLKSKELKISHPEDYKKGHADAGLYGLGQSGSKKRVTGPSWVLADIIGAQIALAHILNDTLKLKYEAIANRNATFYVNRKYSATGYYQAEALFWIYLSSTDESLKKVIQKNLEETFLEPLFKGKENDMYDLGSRSTLKALPLIYYRNFIGDNANIRAVLLKYIWSFASERSTHSIKYLSAFFPKPVHGESLTVAKYAALSSLWAIELLYPNSTIMKF